MLRGLFVQWHPHHRWRNVSVRAAGPATGAVRARVLAHRRIRDGVMQCQPRMGFAVVAVDMSWSRDRRLSGDVASLRTLIQDVASDLLKAG